MNFLFILIFLMTFHAQCWATHHKMMEEQDPLIEDGRPPYMKMEERKFQEHTWQQPLVKGAYYSKICGPYGEIDSLSYDDWKVPVLPSKGPDYVYNFHAQHQDLENIFQAKSYVDYKTIVTKVFSNSQKTNPPVVVWLHGSGGPDDHIPFIRQIMNKGMGYVSFSRFSSQKKATKDGYTETFDQSWEGQDSIPPLSEVAMVYGVCQKLVEYGTEEIIISGHSRGGIITLLCAMEEYAQHFRKINSGGNTGRVIGYAPISSLPVLITPQDLTEIEPIGIFHGEKDGICSFDVMKKYVSRFEKRENQNVHFFSEDFGHLPWDRVQGGCQGFTLLCLNDLWTHKFSPKAWWTHTGHNAMVGITSLCHQKAEYVRLKKNAQNFNNACIEIQEGWEKFSSLTHEGQESYDIGQAKIFMQKNMSRVFDFEEKISKEEDEKQIIDKIVDFLSTI